VLRVNTAGNSYLEEGYDLFKLDATGKQVWKREIGYVVGYTEGAVNPSGELIIAGFSREIPAAEGDSWDIVVRKYDAANGIEKWSRQLGTAGTDNVYALDTDAEGLIYLSGRSITLGDALPGLDTPSATGAFLMQLKP
jgi:outer membrane protein assembly factor BamB